VSVVVVVVFSFVFRDLLMAVICRFEIDKEIYLPGSRCLTSMIRTGHDYWCLKSLADTWFLED